MDTSGGGASQKTMVARYSKYFLSKGKIYCQNKTITNSPYKV
jgi:hypothetical protein